MTTDFFIADTYRKIKEAILAIDTVQVPDIYVISFFKSNEADDLRRPTLTVGYNTFSQVTISTPVDGQQGQEGTASGVEEAKWNYAFWLQNEELVIGGKKYDPVSEWVKQLPFYYTDEQEEEDFDQAFELGEQIQQQFMDILIAHAKRLHDEGIISKKFGKDIPIILHVLEYYDEPLNWTKRANPAGLVNEFESWINSLYDR